MSVKYSPWEVWTTDQEEEGIFWGARNVRYFKVVITEVYTKVKIYQTRGWG